MERGAVQGPRTASSFAWVIDGEQVADLHELLRVVAPDARIVVHGAPPDAIGFSHAARVLHDVVPGTTILTRTASCWFPMARSLGQRPLVGTLRRVELLLLGDHEPVRRPRVPERRGVSFGREPDRAAISELLTLGIRAVTLTGVPGVGKTHLMVEIAHQLAAEGRSVVFVDLQGHTSFGALAMIGRELGIPLDGRLHPQHLLRRMAAGLDRSGVDVLLLDHIPTGAVEALLDLITRTRVQWILSGTRRVGVGSEVTYEVHPIRSWSDEVQDSTLLLEAHAPGLGEVRHAIADVLDGHPLATELVAGWLCDAHPSHVFEWLSLTSRSLADIAAVSFSALPESLRERVVKLSVWPDALGVAMDDPEIVELSRRGWLRPHADLAVPGLPSLRMQPQLRELIRALHPAPDEVVDELHEWVATQSEAMSRMLHQSREPSVFDVVSAWVPTLDTLLTQLLKAHPLSSASLSRIAPVLELRVACGARLGSVDPVLEGLERALQGAGARFDLDPVVVIRLFQARGEAFLHRREWERADADLQRALALATRRGEQAYQARVFLLLARVAVGRSAPEQALEHLRAADNGALATCAWAAEVPLTTAIVANLRGSHTAAMEALDEADTCTNVGATSMRARLWTERAIVQRRLGRRQASIGSYQTAVRGWNGSGRPEEAAKTMFQLALVHQSDGDLVAAEALLVEVEGRAAASGEDARRALVVVQRALIHLEHGHLDAAQQSLVRAVSAARLGGDRAGQGTARGFLALLLHLRGDHAGARDGYRLALRDLESGQDRRYGALFHCLLGAAEAELGNLVEARMLVDMARLRLPDAEPAMRVAIGLFERVVDVAHAGRLAEEGDPNATSVAMDGIREALSALEDRSDNIYVRFAKRYLHDLVKESA